MIVNMKNDPARKSVKGGREYYLTYWLVRCLLIAALFALAPLAGIGTADAGAASSVGGQISRDEIMQRAQHWVDKKVPYSQTKYYTTPPDNRQYRTDCSGYVSMAWHLANQPSTRELDQYSTQLSGYDQLCPGDILLRKVPLGSNPPGHVVLFSGWADANTVTVYEEAGPGIGTIIKKRNVTDLKRLGYVARRYTKVIESATAPPSPASGYQIAFQANTTSMWTAGSLGTQDLLLGMMPGTSPSITKVNGGYQIAFMANTGSLWTAGALGTRDLGLGMKAGTNPSIVAVNGGAGYQIDFQAGNAHR